jgi:hypothetical protein
MYLREAWAKRRYEAHFVSKLTDCDGENSETDTSLDFARDCGYISPEERANLSLLFAKVGRMLGTMIQIPTPFLISARKCDRQPRIPHPTADFGFLTSDLSPTSDLRPPTSGCLTPSASALPT